MTTELLVTDGRPSGPRSRKGVETRARLVDAAKQVFEDNGFLEARISDIAERAGLSHGSFYHYFESKEEVFLEVAVAQEDRLSVHTVVDSGLLDRSVHANIRERVRESNRRFLADYRDEARIMGVIEEVSRYNESVRKVRFERFCHYCERTERAIQRLQSQGLAEPVSTGVRGAGAERHGDAHRRDVVRPGAARLQLRGRRRPADLAVHQCAPTEGLAGAFGGGPTSADGRRCVPS